MTKTSVRSIPMTSVAISGLPVRETTVLTSGKGRRILSISVVEARDWLRETLGSLDAWMTMSPSSRRGMNSAPKKVPAASDKAKRKAAMAIVSRGWDIARSKTGR